MVCCGAEVVEIVEIVGIKEMSALLGSEEDCWHVCQC